MEWPAHQHRSFAHLLSVVDVDVKECCCCVVAAVAAVG